MGLAEVPENLRHIYGTFNATKQISVTFTGISFATIHPIERESSLSRYGRKQSL